MNSWLDAKKSVIKAAREMAGKGLVTGTSGNISFRLPAQGELELMAITPTAKHYDTLSIDDIPIVDFNGKNVEGELKPSVETPLHIAIYQSRKDVNAIIHTHSVFASAAAVAGLEIPVILEDQAALLGGEIKLAGYAPSGTPQMTANTLVALGGRNAALLENHGAVGVGLTMRDAFNACELVEKTAEVYLLALGAGKVNELPENARKHLEELFKKRQNAES
ncbi:MAG: class II aldolase/adducin family protein [Dehalococcoidales bacterium]|nr:class II aldolase/adducin family protein [Dehalococcoidales bacterium]